MRWLLILFASLFCLCVPCYASTTATDSNSLFSGVSVPDYILDSGLYENYVIIGPTTCYMPWVGQPYSTYLLFAFFGSPSQLAYGGYGFTKDTLHFTGHIDSSYHVYYYWLESDMWIYARIPGLFNVYDLDKESIIMSTSILLYPDGTVRYYPVPFTLTFETQPVFSELVQLIYKVAIRLVTLIVLIIIVRVVVRLLLKARRLFFERGIL